MDFKTVCGDCRHFGGASLGLFEYVVIWSDDPLSSTIDWQVLGALKCIFCTSGVVAVAAGLLSEILGFCSVSASTSDIAQLWESAGFGVNSLLFPFIMKLTHQLLENSLAVLLAVLAYQVGGRKLSVYPLPAVARYSDHTASLAARLVFWATLKVFYGVGAQPPTTFVEQLIAFEGLVQCCLISSASVCPGW